MIIKDYHFEETGKDKYSQTHIILQEWKLILNNVYFVLLSAWNHYWKVFYHKEQAKFPDGGSVLGSSQFSILPKLFKKTARFKSGQNGPENNNLLR